MHVKQCWLGLCKIEYLWNIFCSILGWKERVSHLEDQKSLALTIQKAQDPNFNPFKKYEEDENGWFKFAKSKISKFLRI